MSELQKPGAGQGKPGRVTRNLDPAKGPDHEFAYDLFRLREDAGLTLAQLARRTAYSKSALSKVTDWRKAPTREALDKYVRGCGVNDQERGQWMARLDDLPVLIADFQAGQQFSESSKFASPAHQTMLHSRSRRPIAGSILERTGLWAICCIAACANFFILYWMLARALFSMPENALEIIAAIYLVAAMGLAYQIGNQSRIASVRQASIRSRVVVIAIFTTWASFGITELVMGWSTVYTGSKQCDDLSIVHAESTTDFSASQHYASLFFFMLYLAMGVFAALAGYRRTEPASGQALHAE